MLGTIIFVGGERKKKKKEIEQSMLRQKRRLYLEMKIKTALKKFPFRFDNFSEEKKKDITTKYVHLIDFSRISECQIEKIVTNRIGFRKAQNKDESSSNTTSV